MKHIGIVIIVICGYLLLKLIVSSAQPDTWQGFYYPDGDTLVDYPSPIFTTKEQCLNWAYSIKKQRGGNPSDDFECGLNCKREPGRIVSLCEKTVDY